MNREQIEGWRGGVESRLEELAVLAAKRDSDINYIKDTTDRIEGLVKEQNGRVRTNSNRIGWVIGVGSGMFAVLTLVAALIN